MVSVPIGSGGAGYKRSVGREPMVILSIEKPVVNTLVNSNVHSLEVMKKVFADAEEALEAGDVSWKDICFRGGLKKFLKSCEMFVKIDVCYWGSGCAKGRSLVGWLESRFVNVSSAGVVGSRFGPWSVFLRAFDFCSCSFRCMYMFLLFSVVCGLSGCAMGMRRMKRT